MSRLIRIALSIVGVAAALACAVVIGAGGAFSAPAKVAGATAATAGKPGPRGPRGPAGPSDAFAGYLNGPVPIAAGPLARLTGLDIPKAGSYVILAKTFLTGENLDLSGDVTCQLDAHGDLDQSTTLVGSSVLKFALSLEVIHIFKAPGSVDFNCGADSAGASANWIKIVAIRVANLTNTLEK